MLNKLRSRAQDEKGFTLIELLVVILIIGILAAIALPAFLNQRGKAQDTEAKSQVRTMQTAMETLYTDEQSYLLGDITRLQLIEPSLSSGRAVAAVSAKAKDAYTVTSASVTGTTFTIDKTTAGVVSRSCDRTGDFGCPASGKW
jgi:type IV pilus assembly protein PilA